MSLLAIDKTIEPLSTDAPYLKPYADHIRQRILMVDETEFHLTQGITNIADFVCRSRILRNALYWRFLGILGVAGKQAI